MKVFQSSEDLPYDANAIVAAVGGSLGLFLGFSCYDSFKKVLSYLEMSKSTYCAMWPMSPR